jgi:hypothetical protein
MDDTISQNGIDFEPAFNLFIEKVRERITEYYTTSFPSLQVPKVEVNKGRRYWKFVRVDNQQSVIGFVDTKNGDILKAATWRAPAKHSRGSIFSLSLGMEAMTSCGSVRYMA